MRKGLKIALAAGAVALAGAVGASSLAIAERGHHGGDRQGWSHHKKGDHHGWKHKHRRHAKKMGYLMKRFDADEDGKLTQDELDGARKDLLAKHDANSDGSLSLEEFQNLWLEVMHRRMVRSFQRIDVDGDASVTTEEFIEPYSRMVERMDRNEDGVLDKEDKRKRKHHGRHHDKDGKDKRDG